MEFQSLLGRLKTDIDYHWLVGTDGRFNPF